MSPFLYLDLRSSVGADHYFLYPTALVTSLSVSLYEATNDARYLSAATDAASFVSAHMYDGHVIVGGTRLSSPGCSTVSSAQSAISGFAVRGFAMLSKLDSSHQSL